LEQYGGVLTFSEEKKTKLLVEETIEPLEETQEEKQEEQEPVVTAAWIIPSPVQKVFAGVYDAMPEDIQRNFGTITIGSITLAIITAILILFYAPIKTEELVKQEVREKEIEKRYSTISSLKDKRKNVRKEIAKLKKKEYAGLTKEEQTKKKAYEEQLKNIEDDLLRSEDFLGEIDERVNLAIEQARKGTPSKEILEQLKKEGYSKKEIAIMKKLFKDRVNKPDT
jgi:hypothetical protein